MRWRENALMFNQSDALRTMAEKYLQLAMDTKDPTERSKFFDYATAYAQLSEQSEWRETSGAMVGGDGERRDVSEREHGVARSDRR
jgi:hypothetical protein